MNNPRKAISGTELVESILGGPDVDHLLRVFHNKEHAVLEFKASWKPCEGDDASEDDCRWNVIKAIIAMANASGGCIVLGIAENKSGNSRDSRGWLIAGDCDPDHILKNPRLEEKDLIEHTLSGLFKGDGFFRIKTSSGQQGRIKVENLNGLRTLVEPVEVCDCKTISEKVLVLIVHPCKDNNFIFVEHLPESRTSNSAPKKVLFYRDSDLPETHWIVDDMEKVAKYCNRRKIEQLKYTRILNGAEGRWKKMAWLAFFILILLAIIVLGGVMHKHKVEKERQAREEAQRKAEEAQRKAEEATRKAEECQRLLDQLEASNTATQKELDDAKAKLDEASKAKSSAELAVASAQKALQEIKEKAANAVALYKHRTEEKKQWETYCDNVKNAQDTYRRDIQKHCDVFTHGLNIKTNSVELRFGKARKQIPGIAKNLSDKDVVLNLIRNAVEDNRETKAGTPRLCRYIASFLANYSNLCSEACKSLVNDGKEYERVLQSRFQRYKGDAIKICTVTFTNDIGKTISKQVASCQVPESMFPELIFKEDKERIDRTSEAIARLITRGIAGKKAIGEMKSLLEKYPDTDKWQKTDVSSLQKQLGSAVAKELSSIADELQNDAVKHVSSAANDICKAYLKAGDKLTKAGTKNPQ